MISKRTDYETEIVDGLLSQYANSDTIHDFLEAVAGDSGLQEIEDTVYDIFLQMLIDNAEGVQLDVIGKSIKCYRQGLTDVFYRRIIKSRRKALYSNGTIPEILRIVDDIIAGDDITYTQTGRAAYLITYVVILGREISDAMAVRLQELLDIATSAGVGYSVIEGSGDAFRLDIGPGLDEGRLARRII